MDIQFFDTMERKKRKFTPIKNKIVRMYTCGPTVYNFAHIGNFRAYLFEDILRRTLEYHGYKVIQVMNLTDVDDKTIRDSIAAGIPLKEYTKKYVDAFFEDLNKLNVEKAEYYPAATAHIEEMITLIQTLVEKGYAYKSEDNSIYFSISKFKDYGKLARIDMDNQRSGARVNSDEYDKDSVADFALWKAWDERDGNVWWDSPWGKGRPGWHIECSAMSMKYLGKTFDIHTGGIDNMFPHHEDEIAQSESANGQKFVNYWMHCEYLIVDGLKMSKSMGNFYTVRDLISKGYTPQEIRWVLISAQYRRKLNFTMDALKHSRESLKSFQTLFNNLNEIIKSKKDGKPVSDIVNDYVGNFGSALADDLNISEALASVFNLLRESNKLIASEELGSKGAEIIIAAFHNFDSILGVFNLDETHEEEIPADIKKLAEERFAARRTKDFAKSDAIRKQLSELGWTVEDKANAYTLKKN
ncbi:MAG TPA: cysteine--tRNA ligase [Lentisphaeria bacterium]|nr:MAG: cysteine--tRNA ligase [Lentisphaerae bacterium GWF2_38_69]HBM16161.1 cysteine--tRNA ligase [Lentisphaeria bacterium]